MEKFINEEFYNICKKDIDEILNIVYNLMPEIERWQIFKSYYNSEEKVIVCKPITDEYNDKIGQSIDIVFPKQNTSYRLEYKEEYESVSLGLEIQSSEDNNFVMKRMEVSKEDDFINRSYTYEVSGCTQYYDNGYEISSKAEYNEYLNSPSLTTELETIRPHKIRKRK